MLRWLPGLDGLFGRAASQHYSQSGFAARSAALSTNRISCALSVHQFMLLGDESKIDCIPLRKTIFYVPSLDESAAVVLPRMNELLSQVQIHLKGRGLNVSLHCICLDFCFGSDNRSIGIQNAEFQSYIDELVYYLKCTLASGVCVENLLVYSHFNSAELVQQALHVLQQNSQYSLSNFALYSDPVWDALTMVKNIFKQAPSKSDEFIAYIANWIESRSDDKLVADHNAADISMAEERVYCARKGLSKSMP